MLDMLVSLKLSLQGDGGEYSGACFVLCMLLFGVCPMFQFRVVGSYLTEPKRSLSLVEVGIKMMLHVLKKHSFTCMEVCFGSSDPFFTPTPSEVWGLCILLCFGLPVSALPQSGRNSCFKSSSVWENEVCLPVYSLFYIFLQETEFWVVHMHA